MIHFSGKAYIVLSILLIFVASGLFLLHRHYNRYEENSELFTSDYPQDISTFYAEVIRHHWSIEQIADRSRILLVSEVDNFKSSAGMLTIIYLGLNIFDDNVILTDVYGSEITNEDIYDGDIVLVTFAGEILQSYPAQIPGIISVQLQNSR